MILEQAIGSELGNLSTPPLKGLLLNEILNYSDIKSFSIIHKEILKHSTPEQTTEYNLLFIVNRLLKKADKKEAVGLIRVAQQLLCAPQNLPMKIHSPQSTETGDFIVSMINTAEAFVKMKDISYIEIKNYALQVTKTVEQMIEIFSQKGEPPHSERKQVWQYFFPAWLKFSRQFLLHQVSLKS